MGYALTNIVVFGVKLTEAEAESIYNKSCTEEDGFKEDKSLLRYRRVEDHNKDRYGVKDGCCVTSYKQHDSGIGSVVFDTQMWSDGTDSRSDSLDFESGYEHYLGVYVASDGYAYGDDIVYFIKNPPPEALLAFEHNVKPILEEMGIEDKVPQWYMLRQTW